MPAADGLMLRAGVLYVPTLLVLSLAAWHRPARGRFVGALFAACWAIPSLAAVSALATSAGWWSYGVEGPDVAGMPLDLLAAWVLLWAVVPCLLFDRPLRLTVVTGLVAVDIAVMPLLRPLFSLEGGWLLGEALAVVVVLVPALALAGWTTEGRRLGLRATLLAVAFPGLTLGVLVPEALAMGSTGLRGIDEVSAAAAALAVVLMGLGGLLALAGVVELAVVGRGTPVPLDPPTHLVTTGPYAYVRNPLQLGMTAVLLAITCWTGSLPLLLGTVAVVAFSAGFARWHEEAWLEGSFGEDWRRYRDAVPLWRIRLRPWLPGPAVLYVDNHCDPCTQVGRWAERTAGEHLRVDDADLAREVLFRVTYAAADGTHSSGVDALCRVLELRGLGWALIGWTGRLPPVSRLLQIVSDAVGGGPHPAGRETPSPPA